MNDLVRSGLVAVVAVTLAATTFADSANAQSRRGKVAAGVAAGLIIGGIVAGAAAANARSGGTTYVAPGPRASCHDHKRRAVWNEENGRLNRAQYHWDQYEACRNN